MKNKANKPSVVINSVDRSLDIIEYLFSAKTEVSITQIAKDLGLYKSTVYRMLATLQARGYIRKNPETDKYSLGIKMHIIGSNMNATDELVSLVMPYIEKLSAMYHEACNVSVMETNYDGTYKSVIVAKKDGLYSLSTNTVIGSVNECYAAAVGKCLIAFNDVDLSVYEKYPMTKFTDTTITTVEALVRELEKVRQNGYAIDNCEREEGQFCIGAPILRGGKAIAAISISGPKHRFTEKDMDERIAYVREVAKDISAHLNI